MKLRLTERLRRSYEAAPVEVRQAFDDQARDIWQARVTRDWRFYFLIDGDTYIIIGLTRHPK
jgi:hypothetical protein